MAERAAVILVGHGGIAKDTPAELVAELRRLEAERRRRGATGMSAREADLDRQVRNWRRTPESDPYKSGLEAMAERLAPRLGGRRLMVAYNEFCAPSVDDAIDGLVVEGWDRLTLVTTMFTRGGSHAEFEIPTLVAAARQRHPLVRIDYAWPFDLEQIADFLGRHLEACT